MPSCGKPGRKKDNSKSGTVGRVGDRGSKSDRVVKSGKGARRLDDKGEDKGDTKEDKARLKRRSATKKTTTPVTTTRTTVMMESKMKLLTPLSARLLLLAHLLSRQRHYRL